MIDIMKPSHPSLTVDEVRNMAEDKWMKLVGELAFPQRASTMVQAVKLAKSRDVSGIIETGCIRGCAGDGQSTLILAMLALRLNGDFETFDISDVHIANAKKWIGPFSEYVDWNHGDSVEGLSRFIGTVGLVYLDSYDYDAANPRPCQLHQLAEIGAIYGKLAPGAVIVMDDADQDGGGKVALSVDFLKSRGWKEVAKGCQIIMTRQ